MLGHALWLRLSGDHETFGTVRGDEFALSEKCALFRKNVQNIMGGVNVLNDDDLKRAIDAAEPEVIVNCAGIVKQLPGAKYPVSSIAVNALFPHRLAGVCAERNIRLIHISTDCVFSGRNGGYIETSYPDADDLYGRTKYLGEVTGSNCLTIRTSLVGRQLSGAGGLFEWFLSHKGKVRGYRKAIFSGLTVYAMADVIKTLIEKHPALEGMYHVSGEKISKYDLLNRLRRSLGLDIGLVPDDTIVIDRSLDSTRFRRCTRIYIPTWEEMMEDFTRIASEYEKWRYQELKPAYRQATKNYITEPPFFDGLISSTKRGI